MIRFLPLLLILVGCSSSGWITEKPVSYGNSSVYVAPVDAGKIRFMTDKLAEPVRARFVSEDADSILEVLVRRTIAVPAARYRDARMVSSFAQSDYAFTITGVEVTTSANPLHYLVKNGPVFVVKVGLDVHRGETLVFRSKASDYANLSALASTEPGFKKATPDELADVDLQRATLIRAYYSAVGELVSDFFQLNQP